MTNTIAASAPIALAAPGEGEALWSFGCLITVKAPSKEATDGRVLVYPRTSPRAAPASPLPRAQPARTSGST